MSNELTPEQREVINNLKVEMSAALDNKDVIMLIQYVEEDGEQVIDGVQFEGQTDYGKELVERTRIALQEPTAEDEKVLEEVPCNNCQGGGCPTCNGSGYLN